LQSGSFECRRIGIKSTNPETRVRSMNWEAIGAIGEIAGAMAVIVTLIYLSAQIRQNTKASRLAAVQAASENSSRFSELIAVDPELSELFWRGMREPESLDPEEARRFVAVLNVFVRREAVSFYLHKEGVMPDVLWAARVGALAGTLNQPGIRLFLEMGASSLPADFREFLAKVTSQPSTLSEAARRILGIGDDNQRKA
jgi:hypothetical protein